MRILRNILVLFVVALLGGLVAAQIFVGNVARNPGDATPVDDVYVHDSGLLNDKLALAEKMEGLKEWTKAAEIYQEILTTMADRVVSTGVDRSGAKLYTSVTGAVQQRLSKWSPDGIKAYNARFNPAAAEAYQAISRQDRIGQQRVFQDYFVTDTGREAGVELLDAFLEAGEFGSTVWAGERLLKWHPNLQEYRSRIMHRTAIAYHFLGDDVQAKKLLTDLQAGYAGDIGVIAGVDAKLAESLSQLLNVAPPVPVVFTGDSWPMMGGSEDRAKLTEISVQAGTRARLSIDYAKPDIRKMDEVIRSSRMAFGGNVVAAAQPENPYSFLLGVVPSVDHGELFFQDGRRIYAHSLESARPLPGWMQSYPGQLAGRYSINQPGAPNGQQLCVTVTDDRVLAILGQNDPSSVMQINRMVLTGAGMGKELARNTTLVCLDRATGKEIWTGPRDLPLEPSKVRQAELVGSPLIVGNQVIVCARNTKGNQFHESYVISVDLATGKHRWSTYLTSASPSMSAEEDGQYSFDSGDAHAAAVGGRIYVASNLGGVACLDAATGSTVWLSTYMRKPASMNNAMAMRFNMIRQGTNTELHPWETNPPVVSQGKVFVLPDDGKQLLILQADSGELIKSIDLKLRSPTASTPGATTEMSMLIGVSGNRLMLAGRDSVAWIDWSKYDEKTFSLDGDSDKSDSLIWSQRGLPQLIGRPFLSSGSILVPTKEHVYIMALTNGRTNERLPHNDRKWNSPEEGPGTVIATSDQIVIASDKSVGIYCDLKKTVERLDAEIAANPSDVQTRLRYANLNFSADQYAATLARLNEAIALLGGEALRIEPARNDLFNQAMDYAGKLWRDKSAEKAQTVSQLFDLAAHAAMVPQQQVIWRSMRARFETDRGNHQAALNLYQQILNEDTYRSVVYSDDPSQPTGPVQQLAERTIDQIIAKRGRDIYREFEKQAEDLKLSANAAGDPVKLLAVARRFPNSMVAIQSIREAADAYESVGNSTDAARLLQQLLSHNLDAPVRGKILESLARNSLRLPNRIGSAIARLSQAVKLGQDPVLSRPLSLPDGTLLENITLSAAAEKLKQVSDRDATAQLPKSGLPVPQGGNVKDAIKEVAAATIKQVGDFVPTPANYSNHDRLLVLNTDNRVGVYAVGKPEPLYLADAMSPPQPRLAAWTNGNLLLSGITSIQMIQPETKTVLWKIDLGTVPPIEAMPQGAADDNADKREPLGRADEDRTAEGANVARMIRIQNAVIRAGPIARIGGAGLQPSEFITCERITGERLIAGTSTGRIICWELTDGSLAWQIRPSDQPVTRLASNQNFAAALAGSTDVVLTVMEVNNGALVGRTIYPLQNTIAPDTMTMSDDDILVYSRFDNLVIRNLNAPWSGAPIIQRFTAGMNVGQEPLAFQSGISEHFQIVQGKLLALNAGGNAVRMFSLESGMAIAPKGASSATATMGFATPGVAQGTIHAIGSRLFCFGPTHMQKYDLDSIALSWAYPDQGLALPIIGGGVDPNFVIVINSMDRMTATKERHTVTIKALDRGIPEEDKAKRAGRTEHSSQFNLPAKAVEAVLVNGGIYVRCEDGVAQFFKTSP